MQSTCFRMVRGFYDPLHLPRRGRGPAPAQPAMWKLWACPAKENTPALHPQSLCSEGPCLPTPRPADQMWAWVMMAGRPKEPGGHLICNWALCTPHLPAYSSSTTAWLKSTFRGNGSLLPLHALNHKIQKRGITLERLCCVGPIALSSLLHSCFRGRTGAGSHSNSVRYCKHM